MLCCVHRCTSCYQIIRKACSNYYWTSVPWGWSYKFRYYLEQKMQHITDWVQGFTPTFWDPFTCKASWISIRFGPCQLLMNIHTSQGVLPFHLINQIDDFCKSHCVWLDIKSNSKYGLGILTLSFMHQVPLVRIFHRSTVRTRDYYSLPSNKTILSITIWFSYKIRQYETLWALICCSSNVGICKKLWIIVSAWYNTYLEKFWKIGIVPYDAWSKICSKVK